VAAWFWLRWREGNKVVRGLTRTSQRAVDILVLAAAFALAFLLRFDWVLPAGMGERLLLALPFVVAFQYSLLMAFGVPRFSWRYMGLREPVRVLGATAVGAAVLLLIRVVAADLRTAYPSAEYAVVPVGVTLVDLLLSFLGVTGVRGLRRVLGERTEASRRRGSGETVPTLLVGAGQEDLLVAKELEARPDLGIRPVEGPSPNYVIGSGRRV
jgi:FlaA1/EpsC-like NDP-sugar epimerase